MIADKYCCPLCKNNNQCCISNDGSAEGCWCTDAFFPRGIFDLLPAEREKVCICQNCLEEFKSKIN